MKQRNYVAKHVHTYNKPTVQKDRKRELKRGYKKHKGGDQCMPQYHTDYSH